MAISPIGQRCYGEKPYRCKKRFNIISSFNQNKLFAPFVFEGPCNSSVFSMYMKNVLLPELRPGQIVIMDNASFHTSITREI